MTKCGSRHIPTREKSTASVCVHVHASVHSHVHVQGKNCFNNHGNPKFEPGHSSHKKMLSWEQHEEKRKSEGGGEAGQKIE